MILKSTSAEIDMSDGPGNLGRRSNPPYTPPIPTPREAAPVSGIGCSKWENYGLCTDVSREIEKAGGQKNSGQGMDVPVI